MQLTCEASPSEHWVCMSSSCPPPLPFPGPHPSWRKMTKLADFSSHCKVFTPWDMFSFNLSRLLDSRHLTWCGFWALSMGILSLECPHFVLSGKCSPLQVIKSQRAETRAFMFVVLARGRPSVYSSCKDCRTEWSLIGAEHLSQILKIQLSYYKSHAK